MKKQCLLLIASSLFIFSISVFADNADNKEAAERPAHFKGLASETLEEAVSHFSEYNTQLETLINKKALSPTDLHTVHELTYTLENALAKISDELETLAEVLEEVHVGSESADAETVKTQGLQYLETARKLVE